MRRLVIRCSDRTSDVLHVEALDSVTDTPALRGWPASVRLSITSGSHPGSAEATNEEIVVLTQETARELFNWLGVWLHTLT